MSLRPDPAVPLRHIVQCWEWNPGSWACQQRFLSLSYISSCQHFEYIFQKASHVRKRKAAKVCSLAPSQFIPISACRPLLFATSVFSLHWAQGTQERATVHSDFPGPLPYSVWKDHTEHRSLHLLGPSFHLDLCVDTSLSTHTACTPADVYECPPNVNRVLHYRQQKLVTCGCFLSVVLKFVWWISTNFYLKITFCLKNKKE